jgi:acetate---CoA ligase (ADP-forming) subunit beta
MLSQEMLEILSASKRAGWVVEPEAKKLLALARVAVPRFKVAAQEEDAVRCAREIGYPVVAKAVSPKIVHKSEHGAVVVGIQADEAVRSAFQHLRKLPGFTGLLVEEMVSGIELIVGAKIDYQFGPVILLGMGGTGVEIYKDATLRMAPLKEKDVASMIGGLKAHALLEGYRGAEPVNLPSLTQLLLAFSELVMDLQDRIESIDLNPVKCSAETCVVADARIMLVSRDPESAET